jgi:hypothetical protein
MNNVCRWLNSKLENLTPTECEEALHWLAEHSKQPQNSDYSKSEARIAYCAGHFAAGVAVIKEVFDIKMAKRPFPASLTVFDFKGSEGCSGINIVSLGCGPGSDLVGALCSLKAAPKTLSLLGVDREREWGNVFNEAVNCACEAFGYKNPIVTFSVADLSREQELSDQLSGLNSSNTTIIIVNRVIASLPNKIAFFKTLIKHAPHNSMIVSLQPGGCSTQFAELVELARKERPGWILPRSGRVQHTGWNVPEKFWKENGWSPEMSPDYSGFVLALDLQESIQWPERTIACILDVLNERGIELSPDVVALIQCETRNRLLKRMLSIAATCSSEAAIRNVLSNADVTGGCEV